ncbi:MAG: S8 family serine peptidase [Thermoflexales bacterium]|nr:S8 family serine peptidase [Thermoflexales bacterium]
MKSKLFNISMILALLSSLAIALPAGAYVPQPSAELAEGQAAAAQGSQAVNYLPMEDDASLPAQPPAKRWILQLEDPPLAQYQGGVNSLRATAASVTGDARLDVNAAAAVAYTAYLENKQAELAAAVAQAVPGAYVERDYQIVFNGVTVNLPEADERAGEWLSKLPGVVRVFREQAYQLDMYASLPLINAAATWAQLGGVAEAGKGVKVAVIDTGIYITNTCFNPAGYTYPAGFPKMDTDKPAATNAKVIAARAYFRADDPPTAGNGATWAGPNGSSHSTHVGGTIACAPGTTAEVAGYTQVITGVAPAAYLMSYRVFYPTASAWSGSAFDPELIAAIEGAVADGADVVNNSWGGGAPSAYPRALDLAYDAAWDAGVVVIFSAGNAGPYASTMDHPSGKLIRVGASTTSGTIASGILSVSAPEPISPTLQDMSFTTAAFGQALPAGNVYTYPIAAAQIISPANFEGCARWPADTFTNTAALISRGTCDFSQKVYYAQQAGATFVIIHNHATGGDDLISMAAGVAGNLVTIPSIFIGHSNGLGMLDWIEMHGAASRVTFNTIGYQAGSIPDRLASFSSRGPSVAGAMGPDVVAPGVNILSSGYGSGTGEAAHAGFGQASGTSMAAPHVSGSAALLKQLHPNWTPAQIKSALMGTANINVADYDGSAASVLDYGAGRIDLGQAYDPGLTFDRPSLSFDKLRAGQSASLAVAATDVFSQAAAANYTLSISETGSVTTTGYFALSVAPASLSFDRLGDTGAFTVTMEIAAGAPAGDYTGFVWLRDGAHELHIPVWARVLPAAAANPVLLIDGELSPYTYGDYTSYYTSTLNALGIGYDYYDPMLNGWVFPALTTLQQYQTVIWYTGNNYYSDTPSEADQDLLIAYLQGGGRLLATGQDLSSVAASTSAPDAPTGLYNFFLGADYVQDNVFSGTVPISQPVTGLAWAQNIRLDVGHPSAGDGAENQGWVDEIRVYGTVGPDKLEFPPVPFLQAATGDHKANGHVGMSYAAEPTLEKPQQLAPWRTIYLSFGFEGINNPAPGTLQHLSSRQELMGRMLAYLGVEPTVSLANVTATVDEEVTLTATAGFARPEMAAVSSITQYRWDFGDGSAFAVTTVPTATHTYTQTGTFTPRVEVTEIYGHKAIASGTATVETGVTLIYLPIVMKNF